MFPSLRGFFTSSQRLLKGLFMLNIPIENRLSEASRQVERICHFMSKPLESLSLCFSAKTPKTSHCEAKTVHGFRVRTPMAICQMAPILLLYVEALFFLRKSVLWAKFPPRLERAAIICVWSGCLLVSLPLSAPSLRRITRCRL